eukprot:s4955_g3.t1
MLASLRPRAFQELGCFDQILGDRTSHMDLSLRDLPDGCRFNIVAMIMESEDGVLHCRGLSPVQDFDISGAPDLPKGKYTFYDLEKVAEDQPLLFGKGTEAIMHLPKSPFQTVQILDLCSGMGGFTLGGFPCQGYSQQGDQLGIGDNRSGGLCHLLQWAWFLQVDDLLLECVDNVIKFVNTQGIIDRFAQNANMHCQKLIFDLQHQWPVRRSRFWCHLHSKTLPEICIPAWPSCTDFATLGHIMPMDALWPALDEQQLEWDDDELTIYADPLYGADQRIMGPHDKACTFLHSWGHVTRACSCGCRPAFSAQRLQQGGARGFGLISALTGKIRHFHPEEGAVLCTVPPSFRFPMPPRAALCLLGQIAAPLQVMWIQAHILGALQVHFWGGTAIQPLACIKQWQDYLITSSKHRWHTAQMYQLRSLQLQDDDSDQIYTIAVREPITVRELVLAEKAMCGWGYYAIITCNGIRLSSEALLHADCVYHIHRQKCAQAAPFSEDVIRAQGIGLGLGLTDQIIWTFMTGLGLHFHQETGLPSPLMLYPFRLQQLLRLSLPDTVCASWRRSFCRSNRLFAICEVDGHWILLHGQRTQQDDGLHWTLHDGLRQSHLLERLHQAVIMLSEALRLPFASFSCGFGLQQSHPTTCGTVALLQLAMDLGLLDFPQPSEVWTLHQWLLSHHIPGRIMAFGNEELQRNLADLLSSKGVPASKSMDRAQQVISKLGIKQIQTIMQNKNIWAALKSAANKPGLMFRLVTADELTAFITDKAKTKHGAQIPNQRSKKSTRASSSSRPVNLDPDQFELDSAHFQDDFEVPVEQIHFSEVEADKRGIALCTTSMAQKFLGAPKAISVEALALLLVDTPPQELIDSAKLGKMVIPAKCRGTKEHTLIFGYILQLGDSQVSRTFIGKGSSPDIIDTQVLKIQVFRDQLQVDWADFCHAPIRALVQRMEAMQLCKGINCGPECAKFHPAVDEQIDNVIFELWARSFFNDKGQRAEASEATLFTVFMRIPDGALKRILTTTPLGVYAEPRGEKPREHDNRFKVIWLPGDTHEDADHKCRTYSKAICLVRMRNKYGIRVAHEDERTAWAHLRPGIDFMALDIKLIYELFPLPHGTQRHAMTKLLSDWGWQARPLQPGRGNFSHMAWRVGSQEPPPHPVMKGFQVDVVITQVKELDKKTEAPQMIASAKTQKHLRATPQATPSTKPGADPWLEPSRDPWAKLSSKPGNTGGEGKQRYDEIRDELKQQITDEIASTTQAALHAAAASSSQSSSSNEHRLQALEIGMNELKGQNEQFSAWFQQAGDRMTATENAIGAVQHTLNNHQHEIHTLGSTFQSTMKNIKSELSSEMTDNFNKQLSRLEALLEKKQRSS